MPVARNALFAGLCLVLITSLTVSCADPSSPDETDMEAIPSVARVSELPPMEADKEAYQTEPFRAAGVEVYMVHDGDILQVLATVAASGWVSVGFNERGSGMDGANLILGTVTDGTPLVRNDLGRGHTHSEATNRGIMDSDVVLQEGRVSLEFRYPLVFPAGFRLTELESNTVYSLLVAYHAESSDLNSMHSERGVLDFRIDP